MFLANRRSLDNVGILDSELENSSVISISTTIGVRMGMVAMVAMAMAMAMLYWIQDGDGVEDGGERLRSFNTFQDLV